MPPLVISSSVIVGRVGAAGVSTGASLTAVTVIRAVSVAVENAVIPPLVLVSTFVPDSAAGLIPGAESEAGRVGVLAIGHEADVVGGAQQQRAVVGDGADSDPGQAAVESSTPRCRCR